MAPCRRASGGVLQCRAIVPNSSARRASGGVLRCRAIVPNSSARRASGGALRFFGCLTPRVTVAYSADRLGTIDLPFPPDALAAVSCSVELLSPIAPPDALAAVSCSVELLSPIAPPDA